MNFIFGGSLQNIVFRLKQLYMQFGYSFKQLRFGGLKTDFKVEVFENDALLSV